MEDLKSKRVAITIEQNFYNDGTIDGDVRITGPLKDIKLCIYLINEAIRIIEKLHSGNLKAVALPNPGDIIYRRLNQYGIENVSTQKNT